MLQIQMRILRVFGMPSAEVAAIVRAARDEGCPSVRQKERDGEYLVCVQASAPTQAMADEYCEKWTQKLRTRFGDALYGMGDTTLAQATLNALLKKRKLLVAADAATGRLLGSALQGLEHSEAVFDFGNQTYANPEAAKRIITPPGILKKFPGDIMQAAAGRAQLAMEVSGADCAAVYMPATVGQAPFVLICTKQGAAACALSPELSDAAITNNILDLVRRRVLGLRLSASTITFRPGREHALLLVSQEGQPRSPMRFSVRHRPKQASRPADAAKPAQPAAPVGTITFESPTTRPAQPAAPAVTTPPPRRREQPAAAESDTLPNPTDLYTVGPEAAAAARARRTAQRSPEPEQRSAPAAPSLLDQEIPDFSAGLDPAAMEAARQADEKAPPIPADEFQRAASKLFADYDTNPAPAAPTRTVSTGRSKPAGRGKPAAAPAREQPAQPAAEPRTTRPLPRSGTVKNRSLAMIEKAEKRTRRNRIAAAAGILVLIAAVCLIVGIVRRDPGSKPSFKNYGTAPFDESATGYLDSAADKLGVQGYLAWPGMTGTLVYPRGYLAEKDHTAAFYGNARMNAATPSNTVISGVKELTTLTDLETFKRNSGFTLYTDGGIYRCKAVALYYADTDEFDPTNWGDLSRYYDYLNFTLGITARSLFDTGTEPGDTSSFLTLCTQTDDGLLCLTGRILTDGEDTTLATSSITEAQDPLMTQQQYQEDGRERPVTAKALAAVLMRRGGGTDVSADSQTPDTDTASDSDEELDRQVEELTRRTQELLASADQLLAGLTDLAGDDDAAEDDLNQGAEGGVPTQAVTVEAVKAEQPTPAPDPTQAPEQTYTAEPEQYAAAAETIDVTMNGTQQTLDLVQCLAMIAQNELGDGAPAEAYKAQCVAAHCWILSQGGFPSVAGTDPGPEALAAAQEVAHVLVTYNGEVCFTPYFASASTGTASSKDVWGVDRPYLQAVDSPYDQQTATHWNTNGSSTGCARFSRQTLQDRILEQMGVDLSGVDPNSWFTILSANEYGWVSQMQIGPNASGNDTCSGRWFREVLLAGQSVDGRSLRSQCFTVTYDAGLDCFIFDVYGYGHGCGMSQWGAVGYALNGWDYASILTHYYPGTTLTTY